MVQRLLPEVRRHGGRACGDVNSCVLHFLPVGQERFQASVCQGVLDELLEHNERNGGDVGAHERGLRDVVRAATE